MAAVIKEFEQEIERLEKAVEDAAEAEDYDLAEQLQSELETALSRQEEINKHKEIL